MGLLSRPGGGLHLGVRREVEAGLALVRPGRVVLATGGWDWEVALPDGDRPGVMAAGAARRLLVRERVISGRQAVVVAARGAAGGTAATLEEHGIELVVIDAGERRADELARQPGFNINPAGGADA